MKTMLPQEWSLFRYGVSRSWLPLFWADPSGAARNPQIEGEQEEYLSCFLPLSFDFTAQKEIFSDAGSQQEVSSREICPLPRESSGSDQPHTFYMKAELSAYTPAGTESLFTITLQFQRNSKWLLACTKNRFSWEDKFSLLPAALPWPFGMRLLKMLNSLFPQILSCALKSHHNCVASTAGAYMSPCSRQEHPDTLMHYMAPVTTSQQCVADMSVGEILSRHLSHSHKSITASYQNSSLLNWQSPMLNNWMQPYERLLIRASLSIFEIPHLIVIRNY